MPFRAEPVSLSEDERQELERMSLSRSLRQEMCFALG